ncbi:polysulfide reductase [Gordonibacter sp. An230]|uniref:NrfD/PsrC family molybdoenzyme membrane anchor subunit n=1 Tax=Gordonibacter sp. An230 TaxID=1965592 RepID=UPI000B377C31|nr:NrfD/PsrC family molybdoenzyme membrane anchor subunit [Gordonibacter sp. An230]OUO91725.1 polysulfide reductase [Gordonibacter sp. An230]
MFDLLVIGYLFLGGAGGGACVVLSVLEAVRVIAPGRMGLPDDLLARAWPVCAVTLVTGIVCIVADLGRPDRLLMLLSSPRPTPLAAGAYALAVAVGCAAAFSVFALVDTVRASRAVRFALSVVTLAAGLVAITYTGVLLQGLASVLFWRTPLLPATFALSSLSCGVALVLMSAAFVETRRPNGRTLALLARVDGALIVLEAACLAAYVAWGLAGEGTRPAAAALVSGGLAPAFWGGVVAAGQAVPFVMERLLTHNNHHSQLLWIAGFVLAGGCALRFCFVQAGLYDVTQVPSALFGFSAG